MKNKTIAYVEFFSMGHSSIWIRSVVEAFERLESGYRLIVWVPQEFFEDHKDLCSPYIDKSSTNGIIFKPLEVDGWNKIDYPPPHPLHVIQQCAEVDKAEVCFVALNLDSVVKEIAFSPPWKMRTKIVGVLQGPLLHYIKLSSPQSKKWLTAWTYISTYVKTLIMSHRKTMSEILMLDPLAPQFYNTILMSSKFRFLPSDLNQIEITLNPRKYFGLPEDKVILLFPGINEKRKGIFEFLTALFRAFDENLCFRKEIAVVFTGHIDLTVHDTLYKTVANLRDSYPDTPVFLFDRFLTDDEFMTLISASDIVCMPYIKFRGMSGILIHAAAYGRPVLASEFGLVGELVKRYDLGVVCDMTKPEELVKALYKSVDEYTDLDETRRSELKAFAVRYSVSLKQFGEEICTSLIRATHSCTKNS